MRNVSVHAVARTSFQALLAAALFVMPVSAFAQDDPNAAPPMQGAPNDGAASAPSMHMHHHGDRMMGMLKGLNLTDDQKSQIKSIHEKFKADHPTPGSATKADRQSMWEQVKAILTPDQLAQLKAKMKQHRMSHAQPNQEPTIAP